MIFSKQNWICAILAIIAFMAVPTISSSDHFPVPIAADSILFEQNFDAKSGAPEMATGSADVLAVYGKLQFQKGLNGYALLCGKDGAKLRYNLSGNLNFDQAGSVSFWFFPLDWQHGINNHRTLFFATESKHGYFGVQIANGPKAQTPLERDIRLRILYSLIIPDSSLGLPPIGIKGNMHWHLIIIAWKHNTISISIDGAPLTSQKIKSPVNSTGLPSTHFSLGSNDGSHYLLDEFKIYSKKLNDDEIKQLWNKQQNNRNSKQEDDK